MVKRRRLTRKQKAEVVRDQHGQCIDCGSKLQVGEIDFDHRKERRMAVDEEDARAREEISNFAATCQACHQAKTAEWSGIHAKAERQGMRKGQQARRAAGKTKKIQSPGFTRWRKFNGDIVERG